MKKFSIVLLLFLFTTVCVFSLPLINLPYQHQEEMVFGGYKVIGVITFYDDGTFIEKTAFYEIPGTWTYINNIMTIDYNNYFNGFSGEVTGNNTLFIVNYNPKNKFIKLL